MPIPFLPAALALFRGLAWLWRRDPLASLSGRPRVVEGDTLIVRSERVRIAGIDAPERGQRFRGQIFGRGPSALATAELRRVIAGRRYRGLEHQARREGRGLWARGFERPADYRRRCRRGAYMPGWRH